MNDDFDFNQAAELYPGRASSTTRSPRYLRFPSAAEAVRHAIEVLPPDQLRHTSLEVDGARFEGEQIKSLYQSSQYPLSRAPG